MDRLTQLQNWLDSLTQNNYTDLQTASADASFRQYFRVLSKKDDKTYIVMDAPPEKEDCKPFIHVTELIRSAGVNAPKIIAKDLKLGFILLADLGNKPYLNHLTDDNADKMYSDAIAALIKMQTIDAALPTYNEQRLQTEMELFERWYLNHHLKIQLSVIQKEKLNKIFKLLIGSAIEQPQVFVHRDYHSRNLMITDIDNPGVIDYQDAVVGPITYDLVSLFKDCYIEWSRQRVEQWLEQYMSRITPTLFIEKDTMLRWFDLMGVQRHLKVLGIFARLNYRDDKPQYLNDLPLTLKYIIDCCNQYEELLPLKELMEECHP